MRLSELNPMQDLLDEVRSGEPPALPVFTLDQYHQLNEAGILPDGSPIELIDGVLVMKDRRDDSRSNPMTHGFRHAFLIGRLREVTEPLVAPHGFYVRTQLPVTLPPDSEPEPDLVVVKGSNKDYSERHPGPGDIELVVEVAFSSQARDRRTKVRLYAAAGLHQYWIVNLKTGVLEIYGDPILSESRYAKVESLSGNQIASLTLSTGRIVQVDVATLFS